MLKYLFVDMNSYFASVEQQEQPSLRGQPVGVIPTQAETTCCIAASYESKSFGVKTGTMVRDARRLCPNIHLVEARPQLYVKYHHRIVEAVESCLHVEHVCSIDEMYSRLFANEQPTEVALSIAHAVKDAIRNAVGPWVRCSIGLAPNVWLAKVATDLQKPDGLTMILPEQLPQILYTLSLTDLPGIGRGVSRRLTANRIQTIEQLCQCSEQQLTKIWGSKVHASIWWHQLRGNDLPYRPTQRRTVGHSHVLPPSMRTDDKAYGVMVRMIHKAASRMRQLDYCASRLIVRIDYIKQPTWEVTVKLSLTRDTMAFVHAFAETWPDHPPGRLYRVSITLTQLVATRSAPLPLFTGQTQSNKIANVMEKIDDKYGTQTIYSGALCGYTKKIPARISFTQIPELEDDEV